MWGLAGPQRATEDGARDDTGRQRRARRPLPPQAVRAGHQGIFWLHLSAIAVWLFVTAVLGALWAAGKAVPPAVVLAGVGAAFGHGIFLLTHLILASLARKRAAAAAAAQPGPEPVPETEPAA